MKAAFIQTTGSPDVIQVGELPEPKFGGREVLVRVHAVSVNPIDTYVRAGNVPMDLPMPYIIGCDAAGIVEAIGDQVDSIDVGDRVWTTNQGLLGRQGTFAERIAIDQQWCFPLPDDVPFESGAACALVGVTAHLGLFREADLQSDETVLVIGGTGGVGSMVVQMAKDIGARVITTCGSAKKCKRAKELGADVTIDYTRESISEAVHREAPKGVDVFWETRREPNFDVAIDLLAARGRMVLMAGRDARPEFPVGPFYVKECSLHGFVMFKASSREMRAAADEINLWLQRGELEANIARVLTLDEAADSHRLQEAGTVGDAGAMGGKIILRIP
jgi:NADPH2:quinone reductase